MTETGHAKNVANFKELITTVSSFGALYNPSAKALQADALEKMAQTAEQALSKLKETETQAKQATALLQTEFKTLNTLTSQLMGLLMSSGAKASSVEEARTIQKRITGSNSKKKKTETPEGGATETKETRSTSRQSYDSRLDDFEKLVTVLQNVTEYAPNEADFQVSALLAKIEAMKRAIQESDAKEVVRNQAMHERNALLYTPETGLVATSLKVKGYVKAVFGGVKSMQYKSLSKIKIAFLTV